MSDTFGELRFIFGKEYPFFNEDSHLGSRHFFVRVSRLDPGSVPYFLNTERPKVLKILSHRWHPEDKSGKHLSLKKNQKDRVGMDTHNPYTFCWT